MLESLRQRHVKNALIFESYLGIFIPEDTSKQVHICKTPLTCWHLNFITNTSSKLQPMKQSQAIKTYIARILQWINNPKEWCKDHLSSPLVIITSFFWVVYPLKNPSIVTLPIQMPTRWGILTLNILYLMVLYSFWSFIKRSSICNKAWSKL